MTGTNHIASETLVPRAAWLEPPQRRVVGHAIVAMALLVLVAIGVLAVWALAVVVSTLSALLIPLAVAGVFAMVLYPVTQGLHGHLLLPRPLAAGLVVALMSAALPLVLWGVGPLLADQLVALYEAIEAFVARLHDWLSLRFPDVSDYLKDKLEDVEMGMFVPPVGEMFKTFGAYLTLLVAMAFVPLFMFFFLLAGPKMDALLEEFTSVFGVDLQRELHYLVGVFVGYVAAFFQGQLIIALIMAVLYSFGFMLIGLEAALPLGIVSGVLNIVPFLGTVVALLLVLPYALFQDGGGLQLMLFAAAVIALVQLVESWFLTPRIMSDRSGLHPAVVVFSLFFWGAILGPILGAMLAVPLSAFAATLWKQVRYRYFSRVVGAGPQVEAPDGAVGPADGPAR